jgi:hypothetical protein
MMIDNPWRSLIIGGKKRHETFKRSANRLTPRHPLQTLYKMTDNNIWFQTICVQILLYTKTITTRSAELII